MCLASTRFERLALRPAMLLLISVLLSSASAPEMPVGDDWKLPDVELVLLDGKTVSTADFRGSVLILDFWATWCGPCLKYLPEIQKLHERYDENPEVTVLTVHTSWNDDLYDDPLADIRAFMEAEEYTFAVGRDAKGEFTSEVAGSIPEAYIIDKEGIVRHNPGMSFKVVSEEVEALLD